MTFSMTKKKKKQKEGTEDDGDTMVATTTRYILLVIERGSNRPLGDNRQQHTTMKRQRVYRSEKKSDCWSPKSVLASRALNRNPRVRRLIASPRLISRKFKVFRRSAGSIIIIVDSCCKRRSLGAVVSAGI